VRGYDGSTVLSFQLIKTPKWFQFKTPPVVLLRQCIIIRRRHIRGAVRLRAASSARQLPDPKLLLPTPMRIRPGGAAPCASVDVGVAGCPAALIEADDNVLDTVGNAWVYAAGGVGRRLRCDE
jgi:hypothetical protein